MDARHFDRLIRSLAASGTRRGVLGLIATLPMLGGLFALLDPDAAEAKGRRKRRKKAHKHGKGRHKHKKHQPKCKAHAKTKTCAGTCGPVKNNCKKTVDCGPCDCDPPCGTCETCSSDFNCEPCDRCCDDVCCTQALAVCHADSGACCVPASKAQSCKGQCGDVVNNCGLTVDCGDCACAGGCPECLVCDKETGGCVADPSQAGDPCGEEGQVCQSDGACACDATRCPSCTTCENSGFCEACSGCCADDICVASCGDCEVCDGDGQCAPCPGCCDGTICVEACAACEVCDGQGQCASLGQICCGDACVEGVCCEDAQCQEAGAPDCVGHDCVCAANDDEPCASGETCCADGCANLDTDPDHCGACGHPCAGGERCWDGTCVCGDVCADGCQFSSVQAAIEGLPAGSTIRICAGTYAGNVAVTKNLTLLGAGDGSEPGGLTTLDAAGSGRVVFVPSGVIATLRGLRITGGFDNGGGISNQGNLTVNDCTIAGNSSPWTSASGGGIWNRSEARLTMTSCDISDNHANNVDGQGGGIVNQSSSNLTLTNCTVSGNTAHRGGGIMNAHAWLTLNSGTSVTENTAADGGGIYNFGGTVTLNSGTSVTENTAANGGGVYNNVGWMTLNAGSLVCGDDQPQCIGFSPPSGFCGACPA